MPSAGSASDNDVVLRLILRGQDPGEAARFARMSIDGVRAELAAGTAKIDEAFKRSYEAQGKEAQKAAKLEIRESQDKVRAIVGALKEIEREQAKSSRQISFNWRRTMEDLENLTVVATGAWNTIMGGAARMKALGDETARVTNIYGSLKGSIDKMREASGGQIADIDLITTKNRAVQKELALTDDQFAMVAAGADIFADALGTDTKDALDQLVDGLATGRTKMLASAGVIVDTEKAYEDYARRVHKATEVLSEHEKRVATVEASLRALDKKVIESAGGVDSFADKWERANAQITNSKNEWLIAFGQVASGVTDIFLKEIPEAIAYTVLSVEIGIAKLKNAVTFGKAGYQEDVKRAEETRDAYVKGLAQEEADAKNAASKKVADAIERQRLDRTGEGSPYNAENAVGGGRKPGGAARKASLEYTGIERLLAARDAAEAQIRADDLVDSQKADAINQLIARIEDLTPGGGANAMVEKAGQFALGGRYNKEEQEQFVAAQGKAMQSTRELQAAIEESRQKAGGGLLAKLLFGDDTQMDQTYARLDEFKQRMVDTTKNVSDLFSDAGGAIAGAFGQSAAAALADNKNIGTTFRDLSRQIIVSLSAQSLALGAMEVALAAKDAAFGNFPGAAAHLVAAGLFGAVGTAAGLGASMINKPSTVGATTSTRSSPSFASGGGSRSGGGSGGDANITVIINGGFNTKDDMVRNLSAAMDELRRKTGRNPIAMA